MEQLIITGKNRLSGSVSINGFKNAALAVIPAALCADGVSVIDNIPEVEDVNCYIDIVNKIGAKCEFTDKHTLRIDPSGISHIQADFDAVKKIRASYYMLSVMLGRFGKASVALPGGCNFGSRPIDQHIKGLEALGAKIKIEHGIIEATCKKLVGTNIYLDIPSVGATINIMLAAVRAEGLTTIENAAKEPHVVDVANFLTLLGASIKGAGTDIIRISGGQPLHGCEYSVISDMIEAGTFMIASAITGGDVTIKNLIPKHMDSVSAKLKEMNCKITEGDDYIRVAAESHELRGVNVKTQFYPGFPTDLQPQMCALLSTVPGTSILTETVFDNRFQYVSELERLGAKITVDGRTAVVEGGATLSGAEVTASDLRAGVALIVAGLSAVGETSINNANIVDRGYEDIERKLKALGADIRRVALR